MNDHADLAQMLYATPLTEDQMARLAANVTAREPEGEIPVKWKLDQNYPNPFNPSTAISFYLSEPARVTLKVFDIAGRHAATLIDGALKPAGEHQVMFEAIGLTSGTYIYQLKGDRFEFSRTMTLVE